MLGQSIWNRTEIDGKVISNRTYNFVIGAVLLWGFGVNYLMVTNIDAEAVMAIPSWQLILGYLVSVIIGTVIFTKSDNPFISFVGYNFVVVPLGVILVPFVQSYDPEIVERAVLATGMVTACMMILGPLYPKFFFKIQGALFIALIAVIFVEVLMLLITGQSSTVIDWIVVGIFCGYIGFDWARANAIPKTVDNAVDSAASLYIDIINLFIRLLAIMGGGRD